MMPTRAAFFDMDNTLLRCNSGTEWVRFLRARREIGVLGALRAIKWLGLYKLALLDMETVTTRVVRDMAGDSEREMIEKCAVFFATKVRGEVTMAARAALDRHRREGHAIVILSSSTQYVATMLADHLGIEHVLCTRLVAKNGVFTGEYLQPACYGEGKIVWAEEFARERNIDLAASWFYTDSFTDLPMLERVGERRIVNPDPRLRRHARKRGWPIEEWK